MAQEKFENLTSEHALLVFLIAVSGFMVVESFQWNRTTAIFPQFVGTATLVGALLLLVGDYLPEPLHTVVTGSTSITGGAQSEEMRAEKEAEAEERQESNVPDRPVSPALFTGILVTLYIGLSYLVSMFVVTPLFVIAYLVWFERPWYMIVFLTALSIVLAYAFAQILIVPVDRGVLVGDLLYLGPLGVA